MVKIMHELNGGQSFVLEHLKESISLKECVDVSIPIYTFIKHMLKIKNVTELSAVQMTWCSMLNEQERNEVIQAYSNWVLAITKQH